MFKLDCKLTLAVQFRKNNDHFVCESLILSLGINLSIKVTHAQSRAICQAYALHIIIQNVCEEAMV